MAEAGAPLECDIAPLTPADVAEVHAIEVASFSSPWRLRDFYDGLSAMDNFRAVIARPRSGPASRMILGYAAWFDLGDEYHIISLVVRSDYRRRGVGGRLLDHVVNLAKVSSAARLTLEVRLSNHDAISFYTLGGFTPVAVRDKYYEDNQESALVMWRPLRPSPGNEAGTV